MLNKHMCVEMYKKFTINIDAVVYSGGSLVLYGLRDLTGDLDLIVDNDVFEEYKKSHTPNKNNIIEMGFISITTMDNLFNNNNNNVIIEVVDGVKTVSLKDILNLKKKWNRQKDIKDIEVIEKALNI